LSAAYIDEDISKETTMAFLRCLSIALGLVCASAAAYSDTDVTLFGPRTFARGTGEPVEESASFPAIPGVGVLLVTTGADDSRRISSARLYLNDELVVGPEAFSQRAGGIRRDVALHAANVLRVVLASKPGSSLTVRVTEALPVQAGAVVTPAGGVVEVTNPASPLVGTAIHIPPDAVASPSLVTIGTSTLDALPDVPAELSAVGPPMLLQSTSSLLKPVWVDAPYPSADDTSQLRLLLHANEEQHMWELLPPIPSPDAARLRAPVSHFSVFLRVTVTIATEEINTSFTLPSDTPRNRNTAAGCIASDGTGPTNGICAGMSLVTENYFRTFAGPNGEELNCWWGADTAWNASCQAQLSFRGQKDNWTAALLSNAGLTAAYLAGALYHGFVLDYAIYKLLTNQPFTVSMLALRIPDASDPSPLFGHASVVIGWKRTSLFDGELIVYDVNDTPPAKRAIKYTDVPGVFTHMTYGTAPQYTMFAPVVDLGFGISDIIKSYLREFPCQPVSNPCRRAQLTVDARSWWQDSGISVAVGESVNLTATGTWGDSAGAVGPDGRASQVVFGPCTGIPLSDCFPLWHEPIDLLVGRIGPAGQPFRVGSSRQTTAAASGTLQFVINDRRDILWDNFGALNVSAEVCPVVEAGDIRRVWSNEAAVVYAISPGRHDPETLGATLQNRLISEGLVEAFGRAVGAGFVGGIVLNFLASEEVQVVGVNSALSVSIVNEDGIRRGLTYVDSGEFAPMALLRIGDDLCDHSITLVTRRDGRVISRERLLDPSETTQLYEQSLIDIADAVLVVGRRKPLLASGEYKLTAENHCPLDSGTGTTIIVPVAPR
jgi:hypothetical protein